MKNEIMRAEQKGGGMITHRDTNLAVELKANLLHHADEALKVAEAAPHLRQGKRLAGGGWEGGRGGAQEQRTSAILSVPCMRRTRWASHR